MRTHAFALLLLVSASSAFAQPALAPPDTGALEKIRESINSRDAAGLKTLISKDNVDQLIGNGQTPLIFAIDQGKIDLGLVEQILKAGANVNAPGNYGATALHYAAARREPKLVKLLLEHGADVKARDSSGDTPLNNACNVADLESAKLLVEKGARVKPKNNAGFTPLHLAVIAQSLELTELLIKSGAYVNEETAEGDTALHLAAGRGDLDIAQALVKAGADLATKNDLKQTPYDAARIHHHREVADYLMNSLTGKTASSEKSAAP